MTQRIALFFMPSTLGGGSTSFTAHLFKALEVAKLDPMIYRVRARGEPDRLRYFGGYTGVKYQNVTADDAMKLARKYPSLLTAPAHSKHLKFAPDIITRLMWQGMRIVVHDPNEFKVFDHLTTLTNKAKPICIRPTMKEFYPKAVYIPHPYVRYFNTHKYLPFIRDVNAVSIARITFVKRTDMILEANRLLKKKQQCVLHGAENRLYTRHVLTKKFPEFKQGGYGFPTTWESAPMICSRANFAVDLTYFPDDGGGSQYSFMEAWDAGAINVIHQDWLRYPGEMHKAYRCVPVSGPVALAAVLANSPKYNLEKYVNAGYDALKAHDPLVIGKEYAQELLR